MNQVNFVIGMGIFYALGIVAVVCLRMWEDRPR